MKPGNILEKVAAIGINIDTELLKHHEEEEEEERFRGRR